jgi:hypothetical protein
MPFDGTTFNQTAARLTVLQKTLDKLRQPGAWANGQTKFPGSGHANCLVGWLETYAKDEPGAGNGAEIADALCFPLIPHASRGMSRYQIWRHVFNGTSDAACDVMHFNDMAPSVDHVTNLLERAIENLGAAPCSLD